MADVKLKNKKGEDTTYEGVNNVLLLDTNNEEVAYKTVTTTTYEGTILTPFTNFSEEINRALARCKYGFGVIALYLNIADTVYKIYATFMPDDESNLFSFSGYTETMAFESVYKMNTGELVNKMFVRINDTTIQDWTSLMLPDDKQITLEFTMWDGGL